MTYNEVWEMISRMEKYGGSFVKSLAETLKLADGRNRQRLIDAFPDYVDEYGPNSRFSL